MNRDRYWRAKELFLKARLLGTSGREELLRTGCAGDLELRAEVEALLGVGQEDRGALEAEADPWIGREVHGYRIVRLIASGGMGRVYEALQDAPRRTVAIKVLRLGLLSAAAARRLGSEPQLLARLRHPGIAHVYEAGTWEVGGDAVPYYVMELIPGARPITRHAEERGLSIRDRLALFLRVCDAVQHCHHKGVIHRDLKPANILADEAGDPKVIDFGVARIMERDSVFASMETEPGHLIGTLSYMSPEQCAGDPHDPDVRSDVYSLGVVLYELLCGRLPHDLDDLTLMQALRVIVEQPPVPPSALHRGLRGDLEAVLLRSLAKDPARRYQTVGELGRDLRRHLDGEPVEARGPRWWTPALQWSRRHRILAATVLSALIPLLVALATYVAVVRITGRPDRLEIAEEGREVRLLSRSGSELHAWRVPEGSEGVFHCAHLVDRPAQLGGGKVVVLGRTEGREGGGEIRVHDLRQPGPVLWSSKDRPVPRPDRRTEAEFTPSVWIIDATPDAPGPELLIAESYFPYSQVLLRVWDLGGQVLYETWHDGVLLGEYGLPVMALGNSGRIVLCAVNSEHRWDEQGFPAVDGTPIVLLCFEAVRRHRAPFPGLVRQGSRLDPTLRWYKWLGPAKALGCFRRLKARLLPVPDQWQDGWHIAVSLEGELRAPDTSDMRIMLILDAEGREVHRWVYDGYKRAERSGLVPPDATFRLLDYEELPHPRKAEK